MKMLLVAAACAVGASACHHRAPAAPLAAGPAAVDSVRGTVQRAGSDPRAQWVVEASGGMVCVLSAGADVPLDALDGLEAALWGARTDGAATMVPGAQCMLAVTRFAVRAVHGIGAVDGVLRADGASFVLERASGARDALRDVPPRLSAQVGARIFWAGPLDRAPQAYGVLVPAPR